jgi:hypothetical protein
MYHVLASQGAWMAVDLVSESGKNRVAMIWSTDRSQEDYVAAEGTRFITNHVAWIVREGRWVPLRERSL